MRPLFFLFFLFFNFFTRFNTLWELLYIVEGAALTQRLTFLLCFCLFSSYIVIVLNAKTLWIYCFSFFSSLDIFVTWNWFNSFVESIMRIVVVVALTNSNNFFIFVMFFFCCIIFRFSFHFEYVNSTYLTIIRCCNIFINKN